MWLLIIAALHRYDVVSEVSVTKVERTFNTLMECEKVRDFINKPNSICVEEKIMEDEATQAK